VAPVFYLSISKIMKYDAFMIEVNIVLPEAYMVWFGHWFERN